MTDRELLELAARAAGYDPGHYEDADWFEIRYGIKAALWLKDVEEYWNPLTDDGDALRLAVKLRLDIQLLDLGVVATNFKAPGRPYAVENYGDDHCAATRCAIVRAAAEIGKRGEQK
ncbi:hypothetical protein WT41_01520 [Burkholderia territorii]|uniref:hypothetical protein n=1 Tax=Burkholderia territorii TaxID=1503055 RepID=UPI00075DC63B|nr:hypothetical protein [Burkholderia territorii]KWA35756.1 hypothetical protein WT41_01520 [Burkholderia territorii]